MAYQMQQPGGAVGSGISRTHHHQTPFFLDERNPITDEDFLEWRDVMTSWVKSVPDYQRQLLKNIDTPWGQHRGATIDHMLNRIVLYAPNIKNLYRHLQHAKNLDHVWEIIETKLSLYTGSETPLPEYHTCVMPSVHEISLEGGMNISSYCTESNPSIMPMGPNILNHYIIHYKKRGAWNKEVPEPVEKDKDPQILYSCFICPKTFRNNPKKNIYSARGMVIIHLAKDHGQILKIMQRDTELDMTSTIDLIKRYLPNLELENTITDRAENQQPSEKKTVVSINIDQCTKATKKCCLDPYNDVYNYNKRTCKLEFKPVLRFHTCIMALEVSKFLVREHKLSANENRLTFDGCTVENPMKIEIDDNNWNLIEHYANHYRKQGAWNDLFPEKTENQKDAYLKCFSNDEGSTSMDSMIEGYSCKKCNMDGKEKTWYFKAWSVDEKETAMEGIINHLAKFHHLLSKVMKKDNCLDMSSVLKILESTNPSNSAETENEDWVELWCNSGAPPCKYFQGGKRKMTSDFENQGAKFKHRLCGDVFANQELISIPPNLSHTVYNHAANITISNPTIIETSQEVARNQCTSTTQKNGETDFAQNQCTSTNVEPKLAKNQCTSTKQKNVELKLARKQCTSTSQQNVESEFSQNQSTFATQQNVEPELARKQCTSTSQLNVESELTQVKSEFAQNQCTYTQQNLESELAQNQRTYKTQQNVEQSTSMHEPNIQPESVKSENVEIEKKWELPDLNDQLNSIKVEPKIEIEEIHIFDNTDNVGTHSSFSLEDLEMIKKEIKIEEVLKLEEESDETEIELAQNQSTSTSQQNVEPETVKSENEETDIELLDNSDNIL